MMTEILSNGLDEDLSSLKLDNIHISGGDEDGGDQK